LSRKSHSEKENDRPFLPLEKELAGLVLIIAEFTACPKFFAIFWPFMSDINALYRVF
jgi:hypothetical protein